VSDKAANAIESFVVDEHGIPRCRECVRVERPGSSSASSYAITHDGSITTMSGLISTTQGAACWLVATQNGRFAYTANAARGSLSLSAITADSGALALQQAVAAGGLAHPIDMAITNNDHMLYVLTTGSIVGYRVSPDASLTWISSTPMAGTAGLVAR
jgi:6-phosphogluconolactonase